MTLIQKIETAVILALLSSCGSVGCSQPLTPAQQAQYDRVKCEAHALTPVLEQDADAVVRSIEDGRLTLSDVLELTAEGEATVTQVRDAFEACRAAYPKQVQ